MLERRHLCKLLLTSCACYVPRNRYRFQEISLRIYILEDWISPPCSIRIPICVYIYCQRSTFILNMQWSSGNLYQYRPRVLWIHTNTSVFLFFSWSLALNESAPNVNLYMSYSGSRLFWEKVFKAASRSASANINRPFKMICFLLCTSLVSSLCLVPFAPLPFWKCFHWNNFHVETIKCRKKFFILFSNYQFWNSWRNLA